MTFRTISKRFTTFLTLKNIYSVHVHTHLIFFLFVLITLHTHIWNIIFMNFVSKIYALIYRYAVFSQWVINNIPNIIMLCKEMFHILFLFVT